MRSKTLSFKKGVHPPENKHYTCNSDVRTMPAPEFLRIPLLQHKGTPATAEIKLGDSVLAGQLIASVQEGGCAVHSPVSGIVEAIENRLCLTGGGRCIHAVIKNDGKNKFLSQDIERGHEEFISSLCTNRDFESKADALQTDIKKSFEREHVYSVLKQSGIAGMGGAGFPLYKKFPPNAQLKTLIINGAECEPYITCDYKIMLNAADKVIAAALWIAQAYGIEDVIFAVEDNKPLAIESIRELASGLSITVVEVKTKYPQGAERQLIGAVTGGCVPCDCLPYNIGCAVSNVHTLYSAYFALRYGLPCYMRVTTVSGDGTECPCDVIVPLGTSVGDVLSFCGGASADTVKVLGGGPMMGVALANTEYFVAKTTSCILALTEQSINVDQASACINCGRCAKACPYNLMPMFIDAKTIAKDYRAAAKYGANYCVECGCCAYVCPSKRPLVQTIRLAKRMIDRLK